MNYIAVQWITSISQLLNPAPKLKFSDDIEIRIMVYIPHHITGYYWTLLDITGLNSLILKLAQWPNMSYCPAPSRRPMNWSLYKFAKFHYSTNAAIATKLHKFDKHFNFDPSLKPVCRVLALIQAETGPMLIPVPLILILKLNKCNLIYFSNWTGTSANSCAAHFIGSVRPNSNQMPTGAQIKMGSRPNKSGIHCKIIFFGI